MDQETYQKGIQRKQESKGAGNRASRERAKARVSIRNYQITRGMVEISVGTSIRASEDVSGNYARKKYQGILTV